MFLFLSVIIFLNLSAHTVFPDVASAHLCLARQWSCSRVIFEVFTLCGPKRPRGEQSLSLSHWIILQQRERESYKEQERVEGGTESELVYHSSPVLDSTSRWAGNEAEDTH